MRYRQCAYKYDTLASVHSSFHWSNGNREKYCESCRTSTLYVLLAFAYRQLPLSEQHNGTITSDSSSINKVGFRNFHQCRWAGTISFTSAIQQLAILIAVLLIKWRRSWIMTVNYNACLDLRLHKEVTTGHYLDESLRLFSEMIFANEQAYLHTFSIMAEPDFEIKLNHNVKLPFKWSSVKCVRNHFKERIRSTLHACLSNMSLRCQLAFVASTLWWFTRFLSLSFSLATTTILLRSLQTEESY